jgi:hypothetical protein
MSVRGPSRTILLAVFVIALLFRLFFCLYHRFEPDRISTPDSRVYVELAWNLAVEGRFARGGAFSLENPVGSEIFRTPGYPLLILLFILIPLDALAPLILLQILLGSLLAVGGAWMAGRLFSPRAGARRNLLKLLGAPGGADDVRTISDGRRDATGLAGSLGRAGPGATMLVVAQALFNILVLLFFLDGVRRRRVMDSRRFGALLLGVLLYVLLVSLVVASARMRIPVSFILYGFAAHSITETVARMTGKNKSTIIC